jgi:uncharacterized protein YdaU (DUF1376 family)
VPSKTDIWMPLYIGDYLADTSHLDAERSGAYLHLLMHYWRKGPLLNDFRSLGEVSKLRGESTESILKLLLDEFFSLEEDGRWHQKRTDAERAKWSAKREVKSENGTTGAAAKWGAAAADQAKSNRSERLANARRLARHSAVEWQALLWVCGSVCGKCGETEDIVKDHILPIYQNGSDGIENIQPMCRSCNAAKGPESVDYRPSDWHKCLTERLAKPLVNALPLPSPLTSPKPLKAKKQNTSPKVPPSVDPRFSLFKDDFERDFKYHNKVPAPWEVKEASNLSRWLKANPEITQEQWRNILRHRRDSPLNKSAPLSTWIGKAFSWLHGIADEWGKPVNGGKTNGRVENNRTNIQSAFDELYGDEVRGGDPSEVGGNNVVPWSGGESPVLQTYGAKTIEGKP